METTNRTGSIASRRFEVPARLVIGTCVVGVLVIGLTGCGKRRYTLRPVYSYPQVYSVPGEQSTITVSPSEADDFSGVEIYQDGVIPEVQDEFSPPPPSAFDEGFPQSGDSTDPDGGTPFLQDREPRLRGPFDGDDTDETSFRRRRSRPTQLREAAKRSWVPIREER